MENKSNGPVQTESSKTSGQVICPKCGTPFAAGEKKCPSCGETNRLTLCKSCGAQMAKSAKQCPSCGAKQKKPIYKRVWFWILVVIVVMIASSSSGKEKQSTASAPTATPQVTNEAVSDSKDTSAQSDTNEFQEAEPTESEAPQEAVSEIEQPAVEPEVAMGESNALAKAKSYLDFTAFSYTGLIDQLEYEGFSTEEATYGADNCGADWNEQAAKKAKSYLEFTSFSRSGLIDQLLYDGFTQEQAEYGVTQNGY